MPLIAVATVCLAAGLLTGFGGELFLGMGIALAAATAGAALRRVHWCALALLLGGGVLAGHGVRRNDAACLTRLAILEQWDGVVESAVRPGSFAPVALSDAGCSTRARVAISKGSAAAGDHVRIAGKASSGAGSLMIQNAVVERSGGSSALLRLRAAAGAAIDRDFGERAAVVRALLIADAHQIDSDVRNAFADAGLVHILSISGLHVGIIAAAALLLLRAAGMAIPGAIAGASLVTGFYVIMIGAPAPAVRAAAMFLALSGSRLLQRPTSPWALLATGALIPLVSPRTVLSLGYQLSVVGMIGLICAGALVKRIPILRTKGWRGVVLASVATTIVATAITAPIIAWHFGRVSVIAPVTNLIATPVVGVLQPMLFLALLLSPIEPLSAFVADASLPLLAALDWVARVGGGPSWAAADVAPTLLTVILMSAIVTLLVTAPIVSRSMRNVVFGALFAAVLVWEPLLPRVGQGVLEIHMVDVGQGDAIAVRFPDKRWVLFDAGRSWRGGDAGRRQVIPYLRRHGDDLFGFVLSHPHSDHVGGAASVMRWLRPDMFWDAAFVTGNSDYHGALQAARSHSVSWRRVRPGEVVSFGGATLEFLAPDSAWASTLDDPNDASTVALIQYRGVRVLLTGDAEREEEEWLLASGRHRLRADILKIAHHGSTTSTTAQFLAAVNPRVALISVGSGNSYGHPGAAVLERLGQHGAVVFRTDTHGSVVISSDGTAIWAEALGERWRLK